MFPHCFANNAVTVDETTKGIMLHHFSSLTDVYHRFLSDLVRNFVHAQIKLKIASMIEFVRCFHMYKDHDSLHDMIHGHVSITHLLIL